MTRPDPAKERALYADHVRALDGAYDRLLAEHGFDLLLIHSGSPVKRSSYDDQYWPYRSTPHFDHWAALGQPGCVLVKRVGEPAYVVQPRITDFWERPPVVDVAQIGDALSIHTPRGDAALRDALPVQGRAAFLGDDPFARERLAPTAEANPKALLAALDALRVEKSPWEVHCLEEANRRAAAGHRAVLEAFRDGERCELDLHLLYLRTTRQDDWETPYKNILALGEHASILHHVGYSKEAQRSGSLLVDAGATYKGYASDVTRTWVDGREPRAETFLALVRGMELLQQQLVSGVAAGRPYESLHDESHRLVSELLVEAGLVRASAEEVDATGISRVFYPHGLGHSLGLQTHDVGCGLQQPRANNPFLRNTSIIGAAQCFTIEPGLYFVDTLLEELRAAPAGKHVDFDLVAELAPFGGIRIEDDIVVDAQGQPRNLTRPHLDTGGGAI